MGALYPDPFRGRLILTLFQFEVRRGLLSLNQRSGIGFILQDTDNSSSGPFTVLAIRIAAFCMWHPIVPLICQRGEYAHPVQLVCDMGSAEPLQTLSENIPHHIGGIFVNFQALMLITDFYIAVNRKGSYKIAAAPFHFQGAPGLDGNIPAVSLVHNVFHGNREVIGSIVFRVHVIVDGDKAHTVGRKYPAHIAAGLYVFTSQAGEILDNYTVGLALFNHTHHFLKCRAVKKDTAVTVVNLFCHDLNLRVPGNVIIDQPPLVGDAVAFRRLVIGIRKTDVLDCFVNLHKKTLLSLRRKIPAIQEVWLCRIQFLFRFLFYHAIAGKSAPFLKKIWPTAESL